ncbi:MAG: hypothetical protein ACRD96_17740, partial [Bryobacteraceae bacterium]
KYAQAEPLYREAIASHERSGPGGMELARHLYRHAEVLRHLQNYAEAARAETRAMGIRVRQSLRKD